MSHTRHHFFFLVSTCVCGNLPVLTSESHLDCNMTNHVNNQTRLEDYRQLAIAMDTCTTKHMKTCIVGLVESQLRGLWLKFRVHIKTSVKTPDCATNSNKHNPNLLNNFRNQHSPKYNPTHIRTNVHLSRRDHRLSALQRNNQIILTHINQYK